MSQAGKSEPIFHHYVPQFILNNFGERRKKEHYIQIYDKSSRKVFSSNVKRALGENKFNTVKIGKRTFCIEGVTAAIDDLAAPVVNKLIKEKTTRNITKKDHAALLMFIALQINRGTAPRLMHDDVVVQLRAKIAKSVGEGNLPDELRRDTTEEENKLFHLHFSITSISGICDSLSRLELLLFEASTGNTFVIGDGPVAIANSEPDDSPFGNLGLMCKGIEVYLPISPKYTIALFCPSIRKKFIETKTSVEESLRRIEAFQLLANDDLRMRLELDRKRLLEAKDIAQKMCDAIMSHDAAPSDDRNIQYNNALQILHSERYIVGSASELHQIDKMVAEDARLERVMNWSAVFLPV